MRNGGDSLGIDWGEGRGEEGERVEKRGVRWGGSLLVMVVVVVGNTTGGNMGAGRGGGGGGYDHNDDYTTHTPSITFRHLFPRRMS